MLGIFSACKKEKIDSPNSGGNVIEVSFKKDSSVVDQTIQPPKNNFVTFSGAVNTGSVNGFQLTSVEISLIKGGDAGSPKDYLRRIYFTIEDADGVSYTSVIKDSVVNNSFSFDNFLKNYGQFKTLIIKLHADILPGATNGTGLEDNLVVSMRFFYTEGGSAVPRQTKVVVGQKITFSSGPSTVTSNLQTEISSANPSTDTIVGLQEIEILRTKMTSTKGTSVVTDQSFLLSDINASAIVSNLKVYDGSTLVGSGVVSNGSVLVPMNVSITENASKTFSIKAVIGNVGVNASGSSLKITLDNVSYKDPVGIIKNNDTNRVSNSFVLLKAIQTITSVPLSGNLQNGVLVDANKISILSVGSNTATKQLTYKVTLTDNATHTDTLSFKNLYFKIGGTLVNAKFTNSAGQVIDSVGPGDGIVRVTFAVSGFHEYINPVGSSVEYTLGGRFTGFNHQMQDGDVGSVELLMNDNPTNYRIVNSGVAPNNISAKLFDSQAGNSGAVVQNYLWSDIASGASHSFAFGSGSPDAKNASIGIVVNTNPQIWSRR